MRLVASRRELSAAAAGQPRASRGRPAPALADG